MKMSKESKTQIDIHLTIPGELFEDLKKIAQFNNSRVEDLIYCYILDGVTSDSRVVKRMEFTDNANEDLGNKTFHSKPAREIINDLNLAY